MTGPAASRSSRPAGFAAVFDVRVFFTGMGHPYTTTPGPTRDSGCGGREARVGGQVAAPEIKRQQRHGARPRGVADVRRVMDGRARRLEPPRPVVAPPLARGERVVHLDGRMGVQRMM